LLLRFTLEQRGALSSTSIANGRRLCNFGFLTPINPLGRKI
jgi:predicted metalloenzyme YecM